MKKLAWDNYILILPLKLSSVADAVIPVCRRTWEEWLGVDILFPLHFEDLMLVTTPGSCFPWHSDEVFFVL